MGKCREIDNKAFAKVLLLSLQQEFEKLLDDGDGDVNTTSKEFATIKVWFSCTVRAVAWLRVDKIKME